MELKVGQRYKRVRVELDGRSYELSNMICFDALSTSEGLRYVVGIPATSVPASAITIAEEADDQ